MAAGPLQHSSHSWRVGGAAGRARGSGLPVAAAAAAAPAGAFATYAPAVDRCAQFYHLSETADFHDFAKIVTPDVKWRQRGLLQGNRTMNSAEAVHAACKQTHTAYQDLTYTVNASAEENGRCVLFWTATGTNRVGLFGRPATFHKSTFSGVTLAYLAPDGRIRELIEYRQPTHEEMAAFLRPDTGNPNVQRLQLRGHAVPRRGSYSSLAAADDTTVRPEWRVLSVQAATEWVENWTAGPDLENMVRYDMEEFNIYSWPDFEQDVVGRDALEERCSRNAQEAVVIRETVADSATNLVAICWNDFEQPTQQPAQPRAAPAPPAAVASTAASGSEPLPQRSLPREQPTRNPEHGSVEVVGGSLRVHLASGPGRRSDTSMDDPGFAAGTAAAAGSGPAAAAAGLWEPPRMHKYRGITLFGLDSDCKLAWQVTFRELKKSEEEQYLLAPPKPRVML